MSSQLPVYTSKSGRAVKSTKGQYEDYETSNQISWDCNDTSNGQGAPMNLSDTCMFVNPSIDVNYAQGYHGYEVTTAAKTSIKRPAESSDDNFAPHKMLKVIDVKSLPRFPPATRKSNMTLQEKIDLINAVLKKDKLRSEIAREYGITSSTLTGIMHQKDRILSAVTSGVISEKRKRLRQSNFAEVEDALYRWITEVQNSEYHLISGPILQQKAIEIAKDLGYENFRCSNGYLDRFKKRKGITYSTKAKWKSVKKKIQEDFGYYLNEPNSLIATENVITKGCQVDISEDAPSSSMKTSGYQKLKSQEFESERRVVSSAAGAPASPSSSLSSGQRLSMPKPTSQPIPNQHSGNRIPRDRCQVGAVSESSISSSESEVIAISATGENEVTHTIQIKEEPHDLELNEEEALNRELGSLEKFREQQKQIEEANKQKKALLAKTLSERQKKARQEAEKLKHIQKELTILDNLLSADVTVIRDKIEVASRDFLEAQKRYERAEKEFVESKLDLQKKSEFKEQMTEHLYTIIHQNEVRKAKKLAELMKELEMEANEESIHMGTLPPLASFNTINTIHKLNSAKSPVSSTQYKLPSPVSPTGKESQTLSDTPIQTPDKNQTISASDVQEMCSQTSDKQSVNDNMTNESHVPKETLHRLESSKATSEASGEIVSQNSASSGTELPSSTVVVDQTVRPTVVTENVESDSNSGEAISAYSRPENQNTAQNQTLEIPSTWTLDLVDVKHEPKIENS